MKIFGWMADRSGCGYYRLHLPLSEYVRKGGDATWSDRMDPAAREEADVIIGQRVCKDGPTVLWQQLCAENRAVMVLELDDDLFQIDPSNAPAHNFYKAGILDNLARNIQTADVVTVTTEPLADMVRAYNQNVAIVPNCIPGWLLNHERVHNPHFTIGWGGGPSHHMDWTDAAPHIGRFLWRNDNVRAHLVGGMFEPHRAWPLDRVDVTPWVHSVEDWYRTIDFDLGVVPLRPHVFNRSKSPIKTLELAALGIPAVASDAGPYGRFVQHGRTGLLVRRDHEWTAALRDLMNDEQMRFELGTNAHRLAANHTVENNLHAWLNAWQVPATGKAAA